MDPNNFRIEDSEGKDFSKRIDHKPTNMTYEERSSEEIREANKKTDEQYGDIFKTVKLVLSFGIPIVFVLYLFNSVTSQKPTTPVVTPQQATGQVASTAATKQTPPDVTPAPTPTPTKVWNLNDAVPVGKLEYTVNEPKIVSEIKSKYSNLKTENQYVTMTVKIKNNDQAPRDVSTNLFTLIDGSGKKYKHIDEQVSVEGNEILFYETINPGLSRTRMLVFETPKDLSGFTLECNSGVMLAGGEKELIKLEK